MPMYTLYPCSPEGLASTFEAVELPSDEAAGERARALLAEHRSCTNVVVWRGDQRTVTYRSSDPGVA